MHLLKKKKKYYKIVVVMISDNEQPGNIHEGMVMDKVLGFFL